MTSGGRAYIMDGKSKLSEKGWDREMKKQAGKRIFAALLAALLMLTLSACGGGEKTPETPGTTEVTEQQPQQDQQTTREDGQQAQTEDGNAQEEPSGGQVQESTGESGAEQDRYHTDPVPEGKPQPVEPEDSKVEEETKYSCTLSIRCDTILNNMDLCAESKKAIVPADGTILSARTVTFSQGESVFDILQRECRENRIHLDFNFTSAYNSVYLKGIANLYEFDVGDSSGWMYRVNGWFPNYGCSRYQAQEGDVIEFLYTCDLGADVGQTMG